MKTRFLSIVFLTAALSLTACGNKDAGKSEVKNMDKAVAEKVVEVKETVKDVVEEVETVVDHSSDETYVAGYVKGALQSLKDTAECKGIRDTVVNVLTEYKAGNVESAAAVSMVKETMAAGKACMQ